MVQCSVCYHRWPDRTDSSPPADHAATFHPDEPSPTFYVVNDDSAVTQPPVAVLDEPPAPPP